MARDDRLEQASDYNPCRQSASDASSRSTTDAAVTSDVDHACWRWRGPHWSGWQVRLPEYSNLGGMDKQMYDARSRSLPSRSRGCRVRVSTTTIDVKVHRGTELGLLYTRGWYSPATWDQAADRRGGDRGGSPCVQATGRCSVEDLDDRDVVERIPPRAGYQAIVAADGRQAWEMSGKLCRPHRPPQLMAAPVCRQQQELPRLSRRTRSSRFICPPAQLPRLTEPLPPELESDKPSFNEPTPPAASVMSCPPLPCEMRLGGRLPMGEDDGRDDPRCLTDDVTEICLA